MIRVGMTKRLVAIGVATVALGGTAYAAATVLPADDKGVEPRSEAADDSSTSTSVDDSSTTSTVGATSTTIDETTTSSVDTTPSSVDDTTPDSADDTTPNSIDDDACHHGARVSEIARNTPPGPEHGKIVSDAAHQKCDDEGDVEDGEHRNRHSGDDDEQVDDNDNNGHRNGGAEHDAEDNSGHGRGGDD
ncbi:MAG TPA: hypothetical protein VFX21_02755 [Acidimicrobiia bacterium]|nr:hypothetical protein [Acidimicrobiia bacterium]